jgi:hypothetical protein
MYLHALKMKTELDLTTGEIFETKTKLYKSYILIVIGIISIITAISVPPNNAGLAGLIYVLIGPSLTIFYSRRSRLKRRLHV